MIRRQQDREIVELWTGRPTDRRTANDILSFYCWLSEHRPELLPPGRPAKVYQDLHCLLTRYLIDPDTVVVRGALSAWESVHDNGWITSVVQNRDGTFSTWAVPEGGPVVVNGIEDCLEKATEAALTELSRRTGHAACSPRCSGWELAELPPA